MNTAKGATEVLKRTSDYLKSGLLSSEPSWYKVLAFHPPKYDFPKSIRPEVLQEIKQQELTQLPNSTTKNGDFFVTRIKPSLFEGDLIRPQKLKFVEDELRDLFYKQHPWELADPKSLIENEHTIDLAKLDWSTMRQYTKILDGESVVQRTLYIAKTSDKSLLEAYEQAKFEYYRLKILDEAERNVTREEF
ncbi:unnamed protein product [Ambrosiozyma monospora]|uniref:Unnamed protein product n=1 Tax=Ambrosiozyma monospora TaxID=43982 RepID=A0ACB5SXN4_AMBMO|nr:unnamed protein product [Ambrosiozyma monospora]